jgi:hypothetical protein
VGGAASAIRAAVDSLAPGELRVVVQAAPGFVRNRMRSGAPLADELGVLECRREDGRRALLVSYSAHATCIASEHVVCSGDYPGALCRALEADDYDLAVFLAAETGQAGPALDRRGVSGTPQEAWALGEALAKATRSALAASEEPLRRELELGAYRARLALPPYRLPLIGRQLDPALTRWLIGGADPLAWVHALRVGDVVFLGHSFEFSAMIGRRLRERARASGGRLLLTSFNGDHNLYVVPLSLFQDGRGGYELGANLYGPGLGPYLERVSEQVFDLMHGLGGGPPPRFTLGAP